MPTPGKHWFHITFGTHGSWLPGDPRGFRSRNDKVHSSGDHRNPPPSGEHSGLHQYNRQRAIDAVCIPKRLLPIMGETIVSHVQQLGHRMVAVSLAPMHVHLLIELPAEGTGAVVGRIKRRASVAVAKELPGKVWAKGCGIRRVRDRVHQVNTYRYILKHKGDGAWVWGGAGVE